MWNGEGQTGNIKDSLTCLKNTAQNRKAEKIVRDHRRKGSMMEVPNIALCWRG